MFTDDDRCVGVTVPLLRGIMTHQKVMTKQILYYEAGSDFIHFSRDKTSHSFIFSDYFWSDMIFFVSIIFLIFREFSQIEAFDLFHPERPFFGKFIRDCTLWMDFVSVTICNSVHDKRCGDYTFIYFIIDCLLRLSGTSSTSRWILFSRYLSHVFSLTGCWPL